MAPKNIIKLCEFWLKLCLYIENFIKPALLNVLHNVNNRWSYQGLPSDPNRLYNHLRNHLVKLTKLKDKKIINSDQWLLLFPVNQQTDSSKFDTTLIILLIINCTTFPPPNGGWRQKCPAATDTTIGAFILHAREFRNLIIHYANPDTLEKSEFDNIWSQGDKILNGLGYTEDTSGLKHDSLDPTRVDYFRVFLNHLQCCQEQLKKLDKGDQQVKEMSSKISKLSDQNKTLAEEFVKYIERGENANIKEMGAVKIIKKDEFLIWPRCTDIEDDKTSSPIQLTKIYIGYQNSVGWVAVKKCPKDNKAIKVMKKFCWPFTFPNVLYITKIFTEENKSSCYLVTELCDKTLKDYIKSGIEEMEKVEMAITLLRAMEYLHTKEIVHRDIKPSNILFTNGVLKVADFGISRKVTSGATYRTTNAGTLYYQAPDLIGEQGNVLVEFKHDVYSVLVIMFYIFTDGEHPFHFDVDRSLKNIERKKRITDLDFRYEMPINKKIENQLKQFLLRHVASLVKNGEAVTLKEIISFFQEHTKANPYCTTLMKESTSAVSYKRYAILLSFTTETEQKKHFLETEQNIKERKFDEATLNVVFRESVAEGALSSPAADVTLMRNALKRCGFDASRTKDDASVNDLKAMIEDIAEGNQNQTICIFLHISGHGFHCEENDDTFIIFKESEFFAVNQIIRMIITTIGDNNQIIFTIDACRKISSIDRKELDKINLPPNVCILYSCEKGKDTADAGMSASIKSKLCDGANTVPAIFSKAISENITRGLSVDRLFERVESVMRNEGSCTVAPEKQGNIDFVF